LTRVESETFSCSSLSAIEIPRDVEILGSLCFSFCKLLSSVSFELNSQLARIESDAFSYSSLKVIEIPQNVEIVGSSGSLCYAFLSSISFDSHSRLTRIESKALSDSSLDSIERPPAIQFIDGSAFSEAKLNSVSMEVAHDRFLNDNDFLIDIIDHRYSAFFNIIACSHHENIEFLGLISLKM
jgi:hypothetical protein